MRIVIAILGAILLGLVGWHFIFNANNQAKYQESSSEKAPDKSISTNKKASFIIFTNSTLRTFSAAMYHNLSEDVYIESSNPKIVNIKKEGITWDDFFKTLPFSLSRECLTTGTGQTFCSNSSQTLKFYINGIQDPNALDRMINNGDKLLVTYGNENEAEIEKQLQQIPSL